MTNITTEEKMKQGEGMFLNAMDALRLHKNTKWSKVREKVDCEGDYGRDQYVILEQILDGFIFEEKYAINGYFNGFRGCKRYDDETLEVEERKFIDEDGDVFFDYNVAETQLDTVLPENVNMNLQVCEVSVKRNTAMVDVTLTNEDFGYADCTSIEIDFDTFKLKSREIGKIRPMFKDAFTQNEQTLRKIEMLKERIASDESWLVHQKSKLLDLTEKYASLFPMKEVA